MRNEPGCDRSLSRSRFMSNIMFQSMSKAKIFKIKC